MQIMDGSPDELYSFLLKQISLKNEIKKNRENQKVEKTEGEKNREYYRSGTHWSATSQKYLKIQDMNIAYIFSVIKNMIRDGDRQAVLTSDEFKSLIVVLADKFVNEQH